MSLHCNKCWQVFDTGSRAVSTSCGHLYCEHRPRSPRAPEAPACHHACRLAARLKQLCKRHERFSLRISSLCCLLQARTAQRPPSQSSTRMGPRSCHVQSARRRSSRGKQPGRQGWCKVRRRGPALGAVGAQGRCISLAKREQPLTATAADRTPAIPATPAHPTAT